MLECLCEELYLSVEIRTELEGLASLITLLLPEGGAVLSCRF